MSQMYWSTSQSSDKAKNDVKVCTQNNALPQKELRSGSRRREVCYKIKVGNQYAIWK